MYHLQSVITPIISQIYKDTEFLVKYRDTNQQVKERQIYMCVCVNKQQKAATNK